MVSGNTRRLRSFSARCAIAIRAIVATVVVAITVFIARVGAFVGTSLFTFQSDGKEKTRFRGRGAASTRQAASVFQERPQQLAVPETSDFVDGARRAFFDDSAHFNAAVERALTRLQSQQQSRLAKEDFSVDDMGVLRQRADDILRAERLRDVSELIWLKVSHGFQRLDVPLVSHLRGNGVVDIGHAQLNALATQPYSVDAVELIRDHVLSIIGEWSHLVRDYPLQLATVQVGQVYSMSALFGYSLRRLETRYLLERRSGTLRKPSQRFRSYIRNFSPDALHQITSIASMEAENVMMQRTAALFGDIRMLAARARHIRDKSELLDAIANNDVDSVQIAVGDLRRLALEGVALGYLLGSAEADVDGVYSLTPGSGECPLILLGGGFDNEDCSDFRSRFFGANSN